MSTIVLGSINIDLVFQTSRLPGKGETIAGHNFLTIAGGKGANQAVAAAKLGVKTHMIGRVGDDVFGGSLLAGLVAHNINIEGVRITPDCSSGIASIAVAENGDNTIIIIPGANHTLDDDDLEKLRKIAPRASSLLLQLEIPLEIVQKAALIGKRAGIKVILDPAPAPTRLPDCLYSLVDIITPNETEASRLVGFPVDDESSARKAVQFFHDKGVETVVLKQGDRGIFWSDGGEFFHLAALPVTVVDTVAAGDAFNGALAAAIDEGLLLHEAMTWGMAAGALAVTKPGAQSSLPDKATFEAFLARSGFLKN
ncbi:MAG: Ribokinase [Chroococcopsis gigantea SAG 12.99]|jgi:ribokinase|nr:ribokinase [Chlorogloea purpurea SAG 13.99]MDV3001921.1 Ribokinase [Chroococcopsis gigantea SAG 12.99]